MKSVGIVRKVDELGRIVIPVELRRKFGIDIKDSMEIYTEDNCIILKKYEPSCIFCGEQRIYSNSTVRIFALSVLKRLTAM